VGPYTNASAKEELQNYYFITILSILLGAIICKDQQRISELACVLGMGDQIFSSFFEGFIVR